jgi:chromosome segregation ATPase
MDAARAAMIKSVAITIRDNIFSAIKPIDSTVRDLSDRIARLEEHADAAANYMAGTQTQSLEEKEQTATRLAELEDHLTALGDQLSSIKQTVDGANGREQDIKHSIEAINSIVVNTERRVDELFPRLALGEKTHKDLGTLISLFVKRLKRVNASAAEIALRLGDLESRLPAKAAQPEERQGSVLEGKDCASTSGIEKLLDEAAPKAADGAADAGAAPSEANPESKNAGVFERPATPGEESSIQASVAGKGRSDDSRADEHVQSEAFSPSRA